MAPREATGTFPDQYLQYDYEAAAVAANVLPLGLPPAMVVEPPPPAPPESSSRHEESHSPPIDPLSIDPTIDEDSSAVHWLTPPLSRSPVSSQAVVSNGSLPSPPLSGPLSPTGSLSLPLPLHTMPSLANIDSGEHTEATPALEVTHDSMDSEASSVSSQSSASSSSLWQDEDDAQAIHSALGMDASEQGDASVDHSAIHRNAAFDEEVEHRRMASPPLSPTSISLRFGESTTVQDLKYFAERGCIVACLEALDSPRLVMLGTRMLADYAKQSHRRPAVASNRKILQFVQDTMINPQHQVLGREYAVETIRSLTATEASDPFLMQAPQLLETLALVAQGGPFQPSGLPSASEKARLHACIAIMNLSCGKANKIAIAKIPTVLVAMQAVMREGTMEARLKATTCIKNLSNADANDAALLQTPGLVQALGHVADVASADGQHQACTNACLALMNLSIAKANKHQVFLTPGVMDALMQVLRRPTTVEARTKACSALSNLAIGYDNKIPMFQYPGFVEQILQVIQTDTGESRTKACSILWSFAAEMKNQVPVVQRRDILPVLVQVAQEDTMTEARFKCVAALTLLAESLENAVPLLQAGALEPIMDILHEAGPDPTNWKGQTASWCVGFLMNMAQSDDAVVPLRESGVVELLTPLLTLDHYQSLKAAMAVTFCCRFDVSDECYDLLRKTETVIPKIIRLFANTLAGSGGNGYKYGVFTLRSSIGCIAALASGPDFIKERIATQTVMESLVRVVTDFCVDGGTPGAIVGGGRDDAASATLAIRALQSLTAHLIPMVVGNVKAGVTTTGYHTWPYSEIDETMVCALESLESCTHPEITDETRDLASDARIRVQGCQSLEADPNSQDMDVASLSSHCCAFDQIVPGFPQDFFSLNLPSLNPSTPDRASPGIVSNSSISDDEKSGTLVRTFLLADAATGRRFVVPCDPTGGRRFNDDRVWCYRRGRYCQPHETPDPNYVWNEQLQQAYDTAIQGTVR